MTSLDLLRGQLKLTSPSILDRWAIGPDPWLDGTPADPAGYPSADRFDRIVSPSPELEALLSNPEAMSALLSQLAQAIELLNALDDGRLQLPASARDLGELPTSAAPAAGGVPEGSPNAVPNSVPDDAPNSVPAPRVAPASNPTQARQLDELLTIAKAGSAGKKPGKYCYTNVSDYLNRVSHYGKFGGGDFDRLIPSAYWAEARNFAEYLNKNQNYEKLGLEKLPIDNPYDAPPGAIVVVRAGTPGTRHPTAGDISIAGGNGHFYNGGEMGFGGRGNFPKGNDYVLGIYVPAK